MLDWKLLKKYLSILILAAILFSCSEDIKSEPEIYITPQHEIPNYENTLWINSDPISIGGQVGEGKIVLVDFWTYTCVNCIRTFPFINEWNSKYKDDGLVIIGVHTPEFEFEKKIKNIKKSVEENNLDYPIVLDNDFDIWNEFNNRYWPAKYLFNSEGQVVYAHFGEGGYIEAEKEIRKLLEEKNKDLSNKELGKIENQEIDESVFGGFYAENSGMNDKNADGERPFYRMTRELYMGSERNLSYGGVYCGNIDYYDNIGSPHNYIDDYEYSHNKFYLSGNWNNDFESVISGSNSPSENEYLSFKFRSKSVNGVFSSDNESKLFVKLDGKFLEENEAGLDINFDKKGRSYININEPKMYSLLILPEYTEKVITLLPQDKGISVFAFTFGSYEEGF